MKNNELSSEERALNAILVFALLDEDTPSDLGECRVDFEEAAALDKAIGKNLITRITGIDIVGPDSRTKEDRASDALLVVALRDEDAPLNLAELVSDSEALPGIDGVIGEDIISKITGIGQAERDCASSRRDDVPPPGNAAEAHPPESTSQEPVKPSPAEPKSLDASRPVPDFGPVRVPSFLGYLLGLGFLAAAINVPVTWVLGGVWLIVGSVTLFAFAAATFVYQIIDVHRSRTELRVLQSRHELLRFVTQMQGSGANPRVQSAMLEMLLTMPIKANSDIGAACRDMLLQLEEANRIGVDLILNQKMAGVFDANLMQMLMSFLAEPDRLGKRYKSH